MMATTVLPVSTIHVLNDESNYFVDQNMEAPTPRPKKRRLDHLSWEEKIQRKKLKNRVAAQTSRDRKKAKVEQMETAIQQLFNKNETILAECEKLKEANERLQAENVELRQRLQESTSNGEIQEMVGSPSKQLEPSRSEVLDKDVSIEQDISEYLLLHHNYAKTQPKEVTKSRRYPPTSTRKLKTIRPKVNVNNSKAKTALRTNLPVQSENRIKSQVATSDNELVYGTFDECTNTITILVNDDSIPLNEVIVGESIINTPENNIAVDTHSPMLTVSSNSLTIPLSCEGNSSPRSDLGYESLDSPLSNSGLEGWDQSVSELFPSLF